MEIVPSFDPDTTFQTRMQNHCTLLNTNEDMVGGAGLEQQWYRDYTPELKASISQRISNQQKKTFEYKPNSPSRVAIASSSLHKPDHYKELLLVCTVNRCQGSHSFGCSSCPGGQRINNGTETN